MEAYGLAAGWSPDQELNERGADGFRDVRTAWWTGRRGGHDDTA